MYDQNLVYWLRTELHDMINIDKSKIRDSERYFRLFETKKAKILRDYNFTELSIPKEYLELTKSQKQSIRELMTVWHDNIFFEEYLRLICRVGYCYEKKADLNNNTQEYTAILANYQFLKELWKQAYPTEHEGFEQQKRIHTESTQQPQQLKPNCPKCNSNNIISNGLSWYCKNCHKQFLKNPIKKQPS